MIWYLFLIPLFSIWSHDGSHMVYHSTDLEKDCDHMHVDGCEIVIDGRLAIAVGDPFQQTHRGCNVLTHEWWHLMGYVENEIQECFPSQEFRQK